MSETNSTRSRKGLRKQSARTTLTCDQMSRLCDHFCIVAKKKSHLILCAHIRNCGKMHSLSAHGVHWVFLVRTIFHVLSIPIAFLTAHDPAIVLAAGRSRGTQPWHCSPRQSVPSIRKPKRSVVQRMWTRWLSRQQGTRLLDTVSSHGPSDLSQRGTSFRHAFWLKRLDA